MKFKDFRRARKEAIEREEELERTRQLRTSTYSLLLSDICRFKICILATYPSDPSKINISTERFEFFRDIRSDINRNLNKLKELGVDIPEKVEGTINGTSLQDFTCLEDCNKYFEKLESVLRTIIVYY